MMSFCYKLKSLILVVLILSGFVFTIVTPTNVDAACQEVEGMGTVCDDTNPPAQADTGEQVLEFDVAGQFIYNSLTSIGALFASLGGKLLNISLSYFVFDMKGTIDYFGITSVIADTWSLIRDLFNLLFIFGLIFIGFSIILEVNDSKAKSTLGTLIVAALLINFSLYASQIVVDFGNIMSGELSKKFEGASPMNSTAFGIQMRDISSSFIAATDLTNLGNTTIQKANELAKGRVDLPDSKLGIGHALAIGLLIALMLIMIGFVLAAGAVIMFTRFLYLIFLMMFSPVMFLGAVLPKFQKVSSDWWNALLKQTFIGPVYLFMLLVSLRALEGLEDKQTGELGVTAFLLSVLLVCAFAWAALMAAQKFGAYGADYTMGMGKWAVNQARGSLGRNTIGRVADKWDKKLEESGWSSKGVVRSMTGNLARSKYGGSLSRVEAREAAEKAKKTAVAGRDAKTRMANIQTASSILRNGSNPTPDQMRNLAASVRNLSTDQLTDRDNLAQFNNPHVAIHLSDAQIEDMRKSGNFSDEDIQDVKNTRRDGFISIAANEPHNNIDARAEGRDAQWLVNRSVQDVGKLPPQVFTQPNMTQYLVPAMIEARLREGVEVADARDIASNIQNNIINDQNIEPQRLDSWREWARRSNFAARLNLNFGQAAGAQANAQANQTDNPSEQVKKPYEPYKPPAGTRPVPRPRRP